jgi:hypothetical protein
MKNSRNDGRCGGGGRRCDIDGDRKEKKTGKGTIIHEGGGNKIKDETIAKKA